MSGGIPDSFGNLTDLEVFAIGSNNINGTLPPEIFGFKNLKRLEPWGNLDLEGTLPDTINELESLGKKSSFFFFFWMTAIVTNKS